MWKPREVARHPPPPRWGKPAHVDVEALGAAVGILGRGEARRLLLELVKDLLVDLLLVGVLGGEVVPPLAHKAPLVDLLVVLAKLHVQRKCRQADRLVQRNLSEKGGRGCRNI